MKFKKPIRKIVLALLPLVALLLVAGLCLACSDSEAETAGTHKYHCPMHPDYVSDKPGECPICGMRLVPVEKGDGNAAEAKAAEPAQGGGKILFYRNPMNPEVTSPVPAKDEMGMDYVPVYADEAQPAQSAVPGLSRVDVDGPGMRLSGIQTAVAEQRSLARSTRSVGLVTADETRVRHVHTKISGWVEKLYVNSTGQAVRAGQPLLSIYSQELLATQEEYLRAREAAARFAGSSLPEVRRGGEELVEAARRRLQLYDVPASFIATVERTGRPQRAVTLVAPASGFVTTKSVFEGQEVQPGMELFTLTDLSRVWVEADFYEFEARLLRVGQRAQVHLPYDAGTVREGEITFVYPTLSPESRTVKVRLELPNPDGELKPGMYVDVVADLQAEEGLTIPDDAVLESGLRQVVFVERQPGVFEPRQVRVGLRAQGQALVVSGLAEGERVATRANFLLDSESRLRAALSGLGAAPASPAPSPGAAPAAPAPHQH